ncbi:MAG TPA: Tim44 domain-containing protein [Xanthobacteraceae bacterium]|nr:Tim44 domain-containing protein [Xanthobacteraceae bacterium]
MFNRFRPAFAVLALAAGLMISADFADARVGGGSSMGSRGTRTWSTPAPTPTAPSAQPMQRSASPTQPGPSAQPGAAARAPQTGGFFNRPGFMGGLMGGLLGAGLFGMLMGGGFFSGLGSLSGILGLLLQVVLIVVVARLVMGWLRNRNRPALAGGPDQQAYAREQPADAGSRPMPAGFGSAPRGRTIKPVAADFDAFERTLTEVQTAYGRDDRASLQRLLTPEMFGYVAQELDEYARDGVANRLSDVKLLRGDLSEAWNEQGVDYATVAMRYELIDVLVERDGGRVVRGDAERPTQATEFWTFVRQPGQPWAVSAIQQG